MSDPNKKRIKSILVWAGLILPSLGWGGERIVSHLSEASRLKTDLSAKVQATAEELERVKAVQASRTPLLEKIPLMDQKLDEVRDQSKENGRELKIISERLARMEGAMKAQALARP